MADEQQPEDDGQDQVKDLADDAREAAEVDQAPNDNEQVEAESASEEPLSQEALLTALQEAQAKADEYSDQLLRTQAEMVNMQRRAERELENAHKFGLEKFVRELLPIKDSLEMGLNTPDGEALSLEKVQEGLEMTLKMLSDAVQKQGVVEINPVGEAFNPEFHQAMTTQPGEEGVASNTILTVFQKGYLLNERLIRPAMVVVAQ